MPHVASDPHGKVAGSCAVGSAAPQEEQGELLCLRHEVCLEKLGTEGEHASSSTCLSSAHSTLTLLPGRGRGGFAVVCDWWDARTLWAILPCLQSLGCTCLETSINVFLRGPSHA